MSRTPTALLLDFGGVLLRTPFELVPAFEERHGLPPGTVAWAGPFDLEEDPAFAQVVRGELRERAYWEQRACELAELLGWDDPGLAMHDLFELPERDLIRPEWSALIPQAQSAGLAVAVLTNDLSHFHPPWWIDRLAILERVDAVVDLSTTDHLKPDPRAFEAALRVLGRGAAEVLFVDDQPVNVAGAERVGMPFVWFDVTDPEATVADVRSLTLKR